MAKLTPVTIDFETFWSPTHTLSKMSPIEYVMHPETEIISCAIKFGSKPTACVFGEDSIAAMLRHTRWDDKLLIGHNMSGFDSMILAWRFGVRPAMWGCTLAMSRPWHMKDVGGSLKALVNYYNLGVKDQTALLNTKGRHLKDFTGDEVDAMRTYNIADVDQCYQLFNIFMKKTPQSEMKLIDQTIRMLVEPGFVLDTGLLESTLIEERERKQRMLVDIATMVGAWEPGMDDSEAADAASKVLASQQKFGQLLRDLGVECPMKPSPTNPEKLTPALAKTDEAFIALQSHPDPIVAQAAAARLGVKSTLLETRIEKFLEAGRLCDGRLPVPLKYYGGHCVPGDTEVLTRSGWVRIDQWEGGDIVQCTPQNRMKFARAERYVGPEVAKWVRCDSRYVKCDFTFGHTVPYVMHGKSATWGALKAGDMLARGATYLPTAGTLDLCGAITPEQMRVLVMVQADGSWETNAAIGRRLTVFVKRPRKIARARELLGVAGVPFEEQEYPSHPGFIRFIVRKASTPSWLSPERKYFDSWLLDSTPEARSAFLEEILLWDGHIGSNGQRSYSTSVASNAEWAQTMAHLAGVSTSARTRPADGNTKANHEVCFHRRSPCRRHIPAKSWSVVTELSRAYCPQTQTGFWLARSNGHIFVTGNTGRWSGEQYNPQNLPRINPDKPKPTDCLRKSLRAPPGFKVVVADLSGIELRVNHFLWKVPSSMTLFQADPAKADLYKDFASRLYGVSVEEVTKPMRQIGKVAHLGLGFSAGAGTFVRIAKIMGGVDMELEESKQIVASWRAAYKPITDGWKQCQAALKYAAAGQEFTVDPWGMCKTEQDGIRTPKGLIYYPNLRQIEKDSKMAWVCGEGRNLTYLSGGKVCENLVQHLARHVISDVQLSVAKETKYVPKLSVHDELVYIIEAGEAESFLDLLQQHMRTPPVWWPELVTWSEGDIADTYGDAK